MRSTLALALALLATSLAGCIGGPAPQGNVTASIDQIPRGDATDPRPHVVVGISDTGVNPYHEIYRRPNLTMHPCTYIPNYPCDIPALNLTLDADSYEAALEADREVWESVEKGDWYWIPGTALLAVHCQNRVNPEPIVDRVLPGQPPLGHCILDDTRLHGTGTTSSVLMENPDALLAFQEGNVRTDDFAKRGIPVDVYSVSYGALAAPLPQDTCPQNDGVVPYPGIDPIHVKGAGNTGQSTLTQCYSGNRRVISVGGGYAADDTQEPDANKETDVVSYYCRPMAENDTLGGYHDLCGTSFAAPTVAGALSKVILEVRRASGYTGTLENGTVDPIADLTIEGLRSAMNQTASYDPTAKYPNTAEDGIPVNDAAPWLQWGWGFYDSWVANATVDRLLTNETEPAKPLAARTYMQVIHAAKTGLYGDGPLDEPPRSADYHPFTRGHSSTTSPSSTTTYSS